MIKKFPLYDKTYSLTRDVLSRTSEFDRKFKFTLGDRLEIAALKALEFIILAGNEKDKNKATELISCFLKQIDILETELRLAVSFFLMSDTAKGLIDLTINEIKKQARGWKNYKESESDDS